jgi:predicted alpha/beta hydrolase
VNTREVAASCEVAQIQLRARDGYALGACLYTAGSDAVRSAVVLHCGAGIAAASYTRFAQFLAAAGLPVLMYDYRGIGMSRPASLAGFEASNEDWAEYDCAAAIAWMRSRFPNAELIGIAHSFASLLVGGADNAGEQSRLVLIGPHTGYFGDYRLLYRLPMALFWHGAMPLVTRMVGYFPARRLRLGQDLPREVALQWAGRRSPSVWPAGSSPALERRRKLLRRCAALRCAAITVTISDDAFASPAGARRLLSYYPGLTSLQQLEFTPADAGSRRIGHFGFFRRSIGAALWPRLLACLEAAPA